MGRQGTEGGDMVVRGRVRWTRVERGGQRWGGVVRKEGLSGVRGTNAHQNQQIVESGNWCAGQMVLSLLRPEQRGPFLE